MARSRSLVFAALPSLLAVGLACGSPSVKDQPSGPGASDVGSYAAEQPSPKPVASVGDPITLGGLQDEKIEVTVTKVVDPAQADNDFDTPKAGSRFVAVQFRLRNVGPKAYSDSPSNSATLIDIDGQRFNPTYSDTKAGPGFAGSATIASGDTALGFLTFEVPDSSKIAKVQFALSSGFADETGQWTVG